MIEKDVKVITILKDAMYQVSVTRWGKMRSELLRLKEFPETFRMRGDVLFINVNGERRPALITKVYQ